MTVDINQKYGRKISDHSTCMSELCPNIFNVNHVDHTDPLVRPRFHIIFHFHKLVAKL